VTRSCIIVHTVTIIVSLLVTQGITSNSQQTLFLVSTFCH